MLRIWRKFVLFGHVFLMFLALAFAAKAEIGKKLARDAGRSQDIRQQLIAAGVLNAASEIVPSAQVKDAVRLFIDTYFDTAPADDAAVAERLKQVSDQYNAFVGLQASDYTNKVEIQIPTKLL
ncbi:MAG: hypothetical protein AAF709_18030, partial [Pseudomonadota bacterium]